MTTKLRYGSQFKDEIVVAAYNSKGFRRAVDLEVRRTIGTAARRKAQGYVDGAIRTIKEHLDDGLDQSGVISASGNDIGGAEYHYSFQKLADSTIKAKKGRAGEGKFWLDWGVTKRGRLSLREAVRHIAPPKVHYTTRIVGLDRRKGPDRIDFELTLSLSKMDYPLDEMVRRPLLSGKATTAIHGEHDGGKLDVLALLEFGTSGSKKGGPIPPRPWISGFAAEVGNVMFDDILVNL